MVRGDQKKSMRMGLKDRDGRSVHCKTFSRCTRLCNEDVGHYGCETVVHGLSRVPIVVVLLVKSM